MLAAIAEAAPAPDRIVASLARPAPATIAFTEVRFSPLLKAPLVVAGELSRPDSTTLERRVQRPHRELTTIRSEAVRIERDGERPRRFALNRSPELRALLDSFSALLAGDPQALERSFAIASAGVDADWLLTLTPKEPRVRRRIRELTVAGAADEPRCLTMVNVDGGASVILLGAVAEAPLPAEVTREALAERCRAGEAPAASGDGAARP